LAGLVPRIGLLLLLLLLLLLRTPLIACTGRQASQPASLSLACILRM
jgi:hypothetical protein